MSKFSSCVLHHVPQKLLWPSCMCSKGIRGGGDNQLLINSSSSSSTTRYYNSRCPIELRGPKTSSSSSTTEIIKSGWGIGQNCSRESSPTWSTTTRASASTKAFGGGNLNCNTNGTMAKAPPVVFCGPSGAGKSTLVKKLLEEFSDVFGFSISHTTRKPRAGESDGRDYYFVTREAMEEAIKKGEFIEHAEFSGNLYGTSKRAVEEVQKKGKMCILDIDTQGVKQIKQTNLQPRLIFIKPPSLADLEKRLRLRGTETEETLQRRLAAAQKEMEYGEAPGNFELVLVNDQVEPAYQKLRAFLLPDITELRNHLAKSNPNLVYQNGSGDKN